jgi:hypothetical protein
MSLFNQQPNREQQFLSLKFSIGLLSKKTWVCWHQQTNRFQNFAIFYWPIEIDLFE